MRGLLLRPDTRFPMPIRYERDDAHQLIRITAEGDVSGEEWVSGPRRQAAEGCWHYALLLDIRNEVSTLASGPTVWDSTALVQQLTQKHGQRGPIAIVASNAHTQAMAQMYSATTHAVLPNMRLFGRVSDAEAWLATQPRGPAPSPSR
jgi:hypothetical protein